MTIARKQLLLGAASAAGMLLPTYVAAQTLIPSATVTAGGGYSSNPFLGRGSGDNGGSATTEVSVSPRLDIIDDTDSGSISAFYNRTDYLSNYSGNDGYGVSIGANSQLSPRTSIGFSAGYNSSILGAANAFVGVPVIVPTPVVGTGGTGTVDTGTGTGTGTGTVAPGGGVVPLPTTPIIDPGDIGGDIGLIGLRQRRNSLTASVYGSYRPSEVSTWTFGGNVSRNSYPSNGGLATNSRTYGVNTGYSRSLSAVSSIGIQVSATVVDYAIVPDSRFVAPQLTYSRRLAQFWSLNLAAGVSLVDDGFSTNVAPSGSVSLCRSGERDIFCFTAARQPSVSAFGGARNQTSVSASYSYRLAERTTLSAGANYSRSSNGITGTTIGNSRSQDYLSATGTVNQQLTRRLSGYASVSYRDVKGLGLPTDPDLGARVGLALQVGGRR